MFINNLDPTLFTIGPFQIRFYGIVYALGFLLAYIFLVRNRKLLEASEEQAESFLIYLIGGMLVGARVLHFLTSDPKILITRPWELFMIWHGGMSFFGGFIGAMVAGHIYLKRNKLKFFRFADVLVFPLTIGIIFGRIANFLNSEILGNASQVPWCVVFQRIDEVCRHPYQIYASISHILLLIILVLVRRVKARQKLKQGTLFFTFIFGYCALRFITDFWRLEPRVLGLTFWQFACLAGILVTLGFLRFRKN